MDLVELFIAGPIGSLYAAIELGRPGRQDKELYISCFALDLKLSHELRAAIDLNGFNLEWHALRQGIQEYFGTP